MDILHFDRVMIEANTYTQAHIYSQDYTGGQWTYNDEVGYWELDSDYGNLNVIAPSNYYMGVMDPKTYSLAVACAMFNKLAWYWSERGDQPRAEFYSKHYYKVRDHALDTLNEEEASQLLSFLD